jgi:hypothetical protein
MSAPRDSAAKPLPSAVSPVSSRHVRPREENLVFQSWKRSEHNAWTGISWNAARGQQKSSLTFVGAKYTAKRRISVSSSYIGMYLSVLSIANSKMAVLPEPVGAINGKLS